MRDFFMRRSLASGFSIPKMRSCWTDKSLGYAARFDARRHRNGQWCPGRMHGDALLGCLGLHAESADRLNGHRRKPPLARNSATLSVILCLREKLSFAT